jgi:hypothetical protein
MNQSIQQQVSSCDRSSPAPVTNPFTYIQSIQSTAFRPNLVFFHNKTHLSSAKDWQHFAIVSSDSFKFLSQGKIQRKSLNNLQKSTNQTRSHWNCPNPKPFCKVTTYIFMVIVEKPFWQFPGHYSTIPRAASPIVILFVKQIWRSNGTQDLLPDPTHKTPIFQRPTGRDTSHSPCSIRGGRARFRISLYAR